jgi:hypothetical protein
MSRTAAPAPPVALVPALADAATRLVATLQKLLDHNDPKVSLKAAGELVKLFSVLGRNKLLTEMKEFTDDEMDEIDELDEELPDTTHARRAQPDLLPPPLKPQPPAPPPVRERRLDPPPPPPKAPLDGPRLTSFLGRPTGTPPARAVDRTPPGR